MSAINIAGGYGRYAMPLALAGHHVTVIDIDPPHLQAAERNAARLPGTAGRVSTVLADVTKDEDLQTLPLGQYDASLNLAFLYLAPPETAKGIFRRCAPLHRDGGLAVVQFSTNMIRKDAEGNLIKGDDEHQYGEAEGRQVLTEMFAEAGFDQIEISSFTIHEEQPLYWHADVLIGSAIKTPG